MLKYILFLPVISYSVFAYAQVHVKDEPRHHNVFENEFVRILDVHLGPKDTTIYHLHNTPSVFIIFTNTNVGSQLIGKQPEKGINLPGAITYDSLTTPRIHRVWNEDTGWFHVMDVELTRISPHSEAQVLQDPSLQMLFTNRFVNGYKIKLDAGKIIKLSSVQNGYLLVSLDYAVIDLKLNEIVQHRIMKAGHYVWIDAGKNFSIGSKDNKPSNFVLLQLK